MKPFFSCIMLSFFLLSCADQKEAVPVRREPSDRVYTDYQVWAEEGISEVTIRLQFRQSNEEGEAIAVEKPGKVILDGEELSPDSTRFMGVYYETSKPVETFTGEHIVSYIDKSGKEHRDTFTFEPFTLAQEIPETIRKPFQIQLQNFPEGVAPIRLVMVDTSLRSDGVNEKLMIEGGILEITEGYLANLTKGPVTLEIYQEEERPVKGRIGSFGKFTMTYGLRRQFNLVK